MRVIFCTIFLVVILSACDSGTMFTKTINNQTEETITITLFSPQGTNDATINPGESVIVYNDIQLGNFVDETYECVEEIDSAIITISNGRVLMKDIMENINWGHESNGGRSAIEDCNFTVFPGDIQ